MSHSRIRLDFGILFCIWTILYCSPSALALKQLGGGYYCHVLCIANQLSAGPEHQVATAKENCKKYDRNNFCNANSSSCTKDCPGLQPSSGSGPTAAPGNLRANYSSLPESNPYIVAVQWEKVPSANIYIIEYFQFGENGQSEKILGHEETDDTKISITRDNNSLCARYGFRVAAGNQHRVGPFGDDVVLEKPTPIYKSSPTYKLKSLVYTNKALTTDALGGSVTDPNTVEAIVEYSLPPHWRPSDFVAPANDYVHNLMCKRPGMDPFMARSNFSTEKPELVVAFPGKSVESDCTYLYTLFGLTTVCGTEVTFPDPTQGNVPSSLGVFVNISCSSVANSPCNATEDKEAACAVTNFNYTVASNSGQTASVSLSWGDLLNPKEWPIQYYLVRYSLSEKPNTDFVLVPPLVKNIGMIKSCSTPDACSDATRTATIEHLDTGRYFVAQVCAVYDSSLDGSIEWDTVARYPIDLTTNGSLTGPSNLTSGPAPPLMTTATSLQSSLATSNETSGPFSAGFTPKHSVLPATTQTPTGAGAKANCKMCSWLSVVAVTLFLAY